ncbi:MAG: glycerol-3-phosphate 1-O-acyltransferase [Bacteroidetes bacterium]|nr:MAG: glycerol-3-phosphate 1-O-acyltransferase [Bacteroidota bacterium]
MNWELYKVLALFAAYILGSVPTSVWFGKIFYNIDLREYGSGNAGATNALRVFGNKAGALILVLDALKGFAAVYLSRFFGEASFTTENNYVIYQLILGSVALLGHVFPIFAGFRGGKGIATLVGIVIALFPQAVLICLVVFLVAFLPTRYVSLGSMAAAITFPIAVILILQSNLTAEIVFSIAVAVFVPLTHHKNIKRLLKGEENKLIFRKKGMASELKNNEGNH